MLAGFCDLCRVSQVAHALILTDFHAANTSETAREEQWPTARCALVC